MNFEYAQARLFQVTTGFNWTSATLKALVVMSNSTAHLDLNAQFLTGGSGFAVLDEFDGAGYSRPTLTSVTATIDTNTWDVVITAAAASFGATVSNGSRSAKGFVVYLDGANDGARRPLLYLDSVANGPSFPYSPNGGPFRLVPGTRGLWRFRAPAAIG